MPCRYQSTRDTPYHQIHPEKVIVWWVFWSGGIVGPYFFQNKAAIVIIVNGEHYIFFLWYGYLELPPRSCNNFRLLPFAGLCE